ncbi:DUF4410 domain-containing protein [Desulfogranum mediterraneum]|uniref:DUF4410 domain-containing protein n=1 Tax=Desulfogranum mediterraneum TaxID=160661 RepID=UPI001377FB2E|nr:DUF4410 domain-containing protein [Desulfogranum mediterraneum]
MAGQSGKGSAQDTALPSASATAQPGGDKLELSSIEEMEVLAPLTTPFDNIIIGKFTSNRQIQTDYPKAARDCEQQIVKQLSANKGYKHITATNSKKFAGKTAVVDLNIVDMRIASGAARMWGGAFAGSSFMEVTVKVRKAGSKKVIHQQLLSTSNNAWAAAYSGGSSDQSLPSDFGILIGEYLAKIIPAK